MSGFILLSRDLLENSLWRANSDLVRLFIYLCVRATYGKKQYTYSRGAVRITVKEGEFLRSLRKIGEDCAYTGNNKLITWSTSRVSGMLKQLEDDGRIEVLSNSTLGTHLRIVNYESYQDFSSYRRGELRTDPEQIQNKSKQVKAVKTKKAADPATEQRADALWVIYLEEMSPKPPHPRLTSKRASVLMALHTEQLSSNGTDPLVLFRKVLKVVKGSSHHMGTRAYHLPESLFLNEERRESWTHRALAKAKAPNRTPSVSRDWSVDK
jgi:hypothetical protein|tara:strand:+ start:6301 stop:7101 length:801 start_codon:yes stop_codon:yes gene_type:complete